MQNKKKLIAATTIFMYFKTYIATNLYLALWEKVILAESLLNSEKPRDFGYRGMCLRF